MKLNIYKGTLSKLTSLAIRGNESDIDIIMHILNDDPTLVMTRFVDFALSLVISEKGVERIKFYLFHGSQIQRNYASLYFNRLDEWEPVKEAFDKGLIDEIQAYSR